MNRTENQSSTMTEYSECIKEMESIIHKYNIPVPNIDKVLSAVNRETNETYKNSQALRDYTLNQKWEELTAGYEMAMKAPVLQAAAILLMNLFEKMNFDKKFKVEIIFDPDSPTGNIYFKHYY